MLHLKGCHSQGLAMETIVVGDVHDTKDGEKIAGEINNGYEFSNSLHLPSLPNRKGSNVSFNDSLDVLHEFHRKRPVAMGYVETETWREKYTSCRWTVTYLVFTFFTIQVIYIQCMSMALVCMVKNLTTSANSSTSDFADHYVDWDTKVQGRVLLSFFIFFPVTPALFGYLSGKFGGKYLVVVLIVSMSISNMLIPIFAHIHPYIVMGLRAFSGICAGGVFPTLLDVNSRWTPLNERAQMTAFVFSAQNFATILTNTVSGFVCGIPIQGGWPFIFYIFGTFSLLCIIPWLTCVYDYPMDHPRITAREIGYIDRNRRQSTSSKTPNPPWKKILTSKPFWSILIAHSTTVFVYVILANFLPIYVNDILHYSISENGMLSSLPFIGRFFGGIISGILADFLLVRGYLSITNLRKVFQVFGCLVSAPCLIVVSFLDSESRVLAIVLIVLYWTIQSTTNSAFRVNPLDIAPRFVGILNGLTTTAAAVAQLTAPIVSTSIITSRAREEWQITFYICVGVSLGGAIFYAVFASGEEQAWAKKDIDIGITVNVDSIIDYRDNFGYEDDIMIKLDDIITQKQTGIQLKITMDDNDSQESTIQVDDNNQLTTMLKDDNNSQLATILKSELDHVSQEITTLPEPKVDNNSQLRITVQNVENNQLTTAVQNGENNQLTTAVQNGENNQLTTLMDSKIDNDSQEITTLPEPKVDNNGQLTTTVQNDENNQLTTAVQNDEHSQLTTLMDSKIDNDSQEITTLPEPRVDNNGQLTTAVQNDENGQLTTLVDSKIDHDSQEITTLSQHTDSQHKSPSPTAAATITSSSTTTTTPTSLLSTTITSSSSSLNDDCVNLDAEVPSEDIFKEQISENTNFDEVSKL